MVLEEGFIDCFKEFMPDVGFDVRGDRRVVQGNITASAAGFLCGLWIVV